MLFYYQSGEILGFLMVLFSVLIYFRLIIFRLWLFPYQAMLSVKYSKVGGLRLLYIMQWD